MTRFLANLSGRSKALARKKTENREGIRKVKAEVKLLESAIAAGEPVEARLQCAERELAALLAQAPHTRQNK